MSHTLNPNSYHFVYAYKALNSNQYVLEVARSELFDGIKSKRFHPSIVVHWLLVDRHNAYPLKLKWLDETREVSTNTSIGEIQHRTFAGYSLYSEINSGKAHFCYHREDKKMQLQRIAEGEEFELIDCQTLDNIANYLYDFYYATREVVLQIRCSTSKTDKNLPLAITIRYYAKPYDGGFIPNTNAPVLFSLADTQNKGQQVTVHGEILLKHSAIHGTVETVYSIDTRQLLNSFYLVENAESTCPQESLKLSRIFGESFKALTIRHTHKGQISAQLIFKDGQIDEIVCQQTSLTTMNALYASLS
ncbi:hypothetical protein [Agarilytica rhodophyticola]|uniref:hypothetical protein n=1 Tax=Agarilytica rhodophyticola TaxID=1737490 RepID=UPI000B342885|nr:hypothetical protein [Agarilytica rhodophyticola]